MILFGPRMNTVFKSRWKALYWAAGVLMTAYCTVPSPDDTAEAPVEKPQPQHAAHKNPWAKDSG